MNQTNCKWFLMASMLLLSACETDDFDCEPSTIDTSVWPLTCYMDTVNNRPGDDFYMYCNGGYWNSTDLGDQIALGTLYSEIPQATKEREEQTDFPTNNKFEQLLTAPEAFNMSDEAIEQKMLPLEQMIKQANTKEDCIRLMARMYKMGYDKILNISFSIEDSEYLIILEPRVGFKVPETIVRGREQRYTFKNIKEQPEIQKELHKVPATRGEGESVVKILADELGIPMDKVLVSEKGLEMYDTYLTASINSLKDYLWEVARCQDYPFMNEKYLEEANVWLNYERRSPGEKIEDWVNEIRGELSYTKSYDYATKWVSEELKADVLAQCEKLRDVFHRRLEKLDWMSETTKQRAALKLDNMTFNAGYPDNWNMDALVNLSSCNTLIDAVRTIREKDSKLQLSLIGTTASTNGFNAILYVYKNDTDLLTSNAFYTPLFNSIYILPAFMLPPAYSTDAHDALNYATLYVTGHEITHGFDSDGSQYDELGNYRNWWTVQDRMNFEEKYQLLIDCYDHLEMAPWDKYYGGRFCPGYQTLTENIADLGGFELARQAYMEKCQSEGYYGSELDKQEKKFYQAYANMWRSKYNSEAIELWMFNVKDEHAMERERINGVVMNTDKWYELYNVKFGDQLYLEPSRRTHIW